ncbi:DUF6161 domain-containing protein [Xanthomonas citri]|uniref:DUF6161 domain-containing protein n=1 Tax=Xanthomonas citri TaxID=346 RepID=UPI00053817C4|nr:DUF6161 domain-containing protein [Xanthomonas citri]KGU40030.1 hypothetical protein NY97_19485 [Xanthomonas citri pv. fuscans]QWN11803.1 hypothetical protein DGN07_09710 [Xanthomonas citri pv. fuscans]
MTDIKLYDESRVLQFESRTQIQNWLKEEVEAWKGLDLDPTDKLGAAFASEHSNFVEALARFVEASDPDESLVDVFSPVIRGLVFTHSSSNFPTLRMMSRRSGNAFGMAYAAFRSDYAAQWRRSTFTAQQIAWLRSVVLISASRFDPDIDQVEEVRQVSERLNKKQADLIEKLEAHVEEQTQQLAKAKNDFDVNEHERDESWGVGQVKIQKEWADQSKTRADEWDALKRVYDTELGLRAPTTYWRDRAKTQLRAAIVYGIVFAVVMAVFSWVFTTIGVPYLSGIKEKANVFVALAPLVIPAFAAVWVLRILGRLLSESLALMRDASERRTLVMTFLALMKDNSTGKSVIKDEDRILILHALFRPSSGAVVDDAPPVHWFDLLSSRVGNKK